MHMQQQMNQMNPQMNFNNANNMGMYGQSLHQRQQNMNLQGQNFFVPGIMGQNRQM